MDRFQRHAFESVFFFFSKIFLIECFLLIYNVLLVSKTQQSDSPYIYSFSDSFPFRFLYSV